MNGGSGWAGRGSAWGLRVGREGQCMRVQGAQGRPVHGGSGWDHAVRQREGGLVGTAPPLNQISATLVTLPNSEPEKKHHSHSGSGPNPDPVG